MQFLSLRRELQGQGKDRSVMDNDRVRRVVGLSNRCYRKLVVARYKSRKYKLTAGRGSGRIVVLARCNAQSRRIT